MKDGPFFGGGERPSQPPAAAEVAAAEFPLVEKQLKAEQSSGHEGEARFTEAEVLEAFAKLGYDTAKLKPVYRLLGHDGQIISVEFRAPGSLESLQYLLKGRHGRNANDESVLQVNEYTGVEEDDYITDSNQLVMLIDGVWEKWRKI